MSEPHPSRTVAAELTRNLTRDDLEALRQRAGLESLPEGSLADALVEHGFSVEDMVTLLMAALVEKSNEVRNQAREIERLDRLCREQVKAIDQFADQASRLKSVLTRLGPSRKSETVMDTLRALVESPTRRSR